MQNKLLVKEEQSRARKSTLKPSLVGACKTHVTNIYKTKIVFTTSAIECTLYVLHLLIKILVSSKLIIIGFNLLTKIRLL